MSAADVDRDEGLRRLGRGERLIGLALRRAPYPGPEQVATDSSLAGWPLAGGSLAGWSPPLTTWLTDAMFLAPGQPVRWDGRDQPRVTPEIVAVLGERLAGPCVTVADALAAIVSVRAGVVVAEAQGTEPGASAGRAAASPDRAPAPPESITGNGSVRYVVTGPVARPAAGLDLTLEACLVEVDGQVVDSATGAAVAGHPAVALAAAANDLARRGTELEPGWVVFTGGMADAVQLAPATTVAMHFSSLGSIFLPGG